ncbi:MAG TPA: GtrA family protein [Anaerolineales bacterium]
MILTNPKERTRFMRFAAVGAMGAVVDFGIFNLLAWGFHLPEVPSSIFSFIAAVTSNFLWNRYWTYPDSRSKNLGHQVSQFFFVNLIGLLIRTPIFALLENPLGRMFATLPAFNAFRPEKLGHNAALAVAVGVVMLWNYFINRHWTYNDVE